MKVVFFTGFLSLIASTASQAAETLLQVVRLDGAVQTVTEDDLARIGEITIWTSLVGYPGEEAMHAVEHEATGPRLRDVLAHFNVSGTIALDSYRIDVPVEDAINYDVILATKIDGKRLGIRDRGPLWVIYPLKDHPELRKAVFEARGVWQLTELRMR